MGMQGSGEVRPSITMAYAPVEAAVAPEHGRALEAATAVDGVPVVVTERTALVLERRRTGHFIRRRGWLIRRLLLIGDVLGLMAAAGGVALARENSLWYLGAVALGVVLAKLHGLYDRDEERAYHSTVDDITGVFRTLTETSFFLLVASTVYAPLPARDVLLFWGLAIPLVLAGRATARSICRRSPAYVQNTAILGAGDIGQLIARKILQHPEYGINLVGFIDSSPKERRGDLGDLSTLGPPEDLDRLVRELDLDRIIVAFSGETTEDTLALVRSLRGRPIQIDIVPRLFEAVGPSTAIHAIEGLPVMGLPAVRISRSSRWMKRTFDLTIGLAMLLVLSPLLAFIALRVKLGSPGPVIFKQTRLAMDRRPFEMLKFRTMHADTDAGAHRDYIRATMSPSASPTESGLYKLDRPDDVTSFGAWLRRTSLDELPQLLNVVRGDMSLVGPRPCIPYETEFFEPHHFERFLVPQGVTGLWQVEGRALMTPKEALDLDVAYARGWSLGLDLSLILRTISQLIRRDRAC
jgi:exopolysaccharide biosynthesis polyprenyl glycosylphosphotransferase